MLHSGVRLLEWFFSTPMMLILVKQLHKYAVVPPINSGSFKYVKAARRNSKGGKGSGRAKQYKPPSSSKFVQVDLAMLVFGCVGDIMPVSPGGRIFALTLSMGCLLYILYHVVRCLQHAAAASVRQGFLPEPHDNAGGCNMGRYTLYWLYLIAAVNVLSWLVYPVIFVARELDYLDVHGMNLWFSIGDAFAKLSLSSVYIASCMRILDLADERTFLGWVV